jgi:signal transduction histidine kinase
MDSIYERLSRISFLSKSYSFKFLFITFISVYVPLIILILIIDSGAYNISGLNAFIIVTLISIIAASITYFLVTKLITPLKTAQESLDNYLSSHTLPTLPTHYNDEVGILMQKIQFTLHTLDSLIKEKKDIAALLSHDIRSPLNVFIGLSELIKEEESKEVINSYCDLIIQESTTQLDFLKDIMEMMEYHDMIIQQQDLQPIPLYTLVHQAIASVQSQLLLKQITVDVNVEKNLIIKVQSKLFIQVLHNLFTNAIKFSHPGGKISVFGKKENNQTYIQVKDFGIGFQQEDASQMFQRFTKKGRSGTAGEKSTGLGLYLTNMLVLKHNGKIKAESNGENTGATFTVNLPA